MTMEPDPGGCIFKIFHPFKGTWAFETMRFKGGIALGKLPAGIPRITIWRK